jgi:hypothetical protein
MVFDRGQLIEEVPTVFGCLNELCTKVIDDLVHLTALVTAKLGGELLLDICHSLGNSLVIKTL